MEYIFYVLLALIVSVTVITMTLIIVGRNRED